MKCEKKLQVFSIAELMKLKLEVRVSSPTLRSQPCIEIFLLFLQKVFKNSCLAAKWVPLLKTPIRRTAACPELAQVPGPLSRASSTDPESFNLLAVPAQALAESCPEAWERPELRAAAGPRREDGVWCTAGLCWHRAPLNHFRPSPCHRQGGQDEQLTQVPAASSALPSWAVKQQDPWVCDLLRPRTSYLSLSVECVLWFSACRS